MRFTVFALSPIPDVETARHNFDLQDVSDKDVAKVLYHQRKQHTGHSEALNWDQLKIAGLTMVSYSLDYVEMGSYNLRNMSERELIERFFKAQSTSGLVVSWNGNSDAIPLLHYRCMKYRISQPAYWQAVRMGQEVHIDLHDTLAPTGVEVPSLDAFARRFGFPGMLGHSLDSVWASHLAGDCEGVSGYSDFLALNTYLLALKVLALRGDLTHQDTARARMRLHDYLQKYARPRKRFRPFLDAWRDEL